MMFNVAYGLLLGFFFSLFCGKAYPQEFPGVVKVSKERKQAYQALLLQNKTVVAFIENTLLQNGLPKVLRNLSLIESGFNKNIVSSARAGGMWQFMEAHAARYGLKSEDRFDVYHSTLTAMKSLKNLYAKYKNWLSVVAAYNCGEGNIKKAMDKAKSDRYEKFYVYLPAETIHHVHKFMEVCSVTHELDFIITDYKISGFKPNPKPENKPDKQKKNPALASTEINTAYNLNIIAKEMHITRADLDQWNPSIENELIKSGIAMLYLPIDKMPDFLLLKNIILNRSLQTSVDDD
ncbi:transglycosylase SLT domain-containing protein [Elizabethkingia argentiflava]|uniref:Transglycosylase SLT domain-containing protein n=1 Tax=Elizabethkingia argenteiflava TaxID=2681556 RepID=A0A845PV88_9FLAO|nr:lytic transglycosylase domain-containing protein [Elizabethkingia argenteiflava]NAW50020.1 transglycosylase SLT domain-containing protein [Elizabethkingia argenteiflava]